MQFEPWDLGDDWPWWHWDPGGLVDDRYSERSLWDPGIEGSVFDGLTRRHSSTQRFIWDPGIGSQLHQANRVVHIFRLFEGKQSWGRGFVMFQILFFSIIQPGWISRIGDGQAIRAGSCY